MTAIKNGTLLVKDSNGNTARVATLSQTDITTLNTALTDIEANKRKISSISANYVTTNTDQTISAQKTFSYQSEPIHIKETRFDVSLKPSENVNNSVVTFDKNNKEVGYYQVSQESNGNNSTSIAALHYKTDGTLVRGSIRVGVNDKGDTYTYAPNPSNDSNNTEIATTKFVNDKISSIGSNYVTTNTAQTITGQKTFTTSSKKIATRLKITDVDNTVTPTSNLWTNAVAAFDKNDKGMGALQFVRTTEGKTHVGIQAMNQNSNGYDVSASISISVNNEGVVTTRAPTPSASSNDLSIATTEWVNNKVNPIKNNYVTTNTAQTITGQKTFTAGTTILKNTNFDALTTDKGAFVSRIISQDKNGLGCNYINFWQNNDEAGNYKRFSSTSIGVNLNKDDGTNVFGNIHLDGIIDKSGAVNFYAYAPTPDYRSTNNQIATCEWVRSYIMPAGSIIPFAGSSIPTGYLLCNGAVVSRTTYANLFRVIGTTYGAGDGSTTFKLPDLRDRFLEGAGTNAVGRYLSAGLPNITGHLIHAVGAEVIAEESYVTEWSEQWWATTGGSAIGTFAYDMSATRSSAIYGKSTTVQPNAITVQYLIKY